MLKLKERNLGFDLLRIIACYLVIINHTNSSVFIENFPSLSGSISLLFFLVSKMGVPIFFMISGALLLSRDESYKDWLQKRVLRMGIIIIAASFFVVVMTYRTEIFTEFSIVAFIENLIKEPIILSYWYLYSYFTLLLILPFLRKMIRNFENKDFLLFIGLGMFVTVVYPFLGLFLPLPVISNYAIFPLFCGPLLYFVTGYYVTHVYCSENKFQRVKENIIGCLVFCLMLGISYFMTSNEYYSNGSFSLNLDNAYLLPHFLNSVICFYLIYRNMKCTHVSEWLQKVILIISSSTFGIYLIHFTMISYTWRINAFLENIMNDLIALLIYQVILFIICFIIVRIVKFIPLFKKYL